MANPSPKPLTIDQKQKIWRETCCGTLRQVIGLMDKTTRRHLDLKITQKNTDVREGLEWLIHEIETAQVPLERLEFLTWLQQPKVDPDGPTPTPSK